MLGRPVLYKQYGKFEATLIKKLTSSTSTAASIDIADSMKNADFYNVMNYHIWEQEMCLKLCTKQSIQTQTIVGIVIIIMILWKMLTI